MVSGPAENREYVRRRRSVDNSQHRTGRFDNTSKKEEESERENWISLNNVASIGVIRRCTRESLDTRFYKK